VLSGRPRSLDFSGSRTYREQIYTETDSIGNGLKRLSVELSAIATVQPPVQTFFYFSPTLMFIAFFLFYFVFVCLSLNVIFAV